MIFVAEHFLYIEILQCDAPPRPVVPADTLSLERLAAPKAIGSGLERAGTAMIGLRMRRIERLTLAKVPLPGQERGGTTVTGIPKRKMEWRTAAKVPAPSQELGGRAVPCLPKRKIERQIFPAKMPVKVPLEKIKGIVRAKYSLNNVNY